MILTVGIVACLAMMAHFIDHSFVAWALEGLMIFSLVVGLIFFLGTVIGIIRFPDFYTRLHAAGKGDTLSTIMMLFACVLYAITSAQGLDKSSILTAIKLLLIIKFIFIGSPTATHALIHAGYQSTVGPWKKTPNDSSN